MKLKFKAINGLIMVAAFIMIGAFSIKAEAALYIVLPESAFDVDYYRESNPDLTDYGLDDEGLLIHYVNMGKYEGRKPYETLDPQALTELTVRTMHLIEPDYKVLAIGNSITYHPTCDYWWGSWGMAASSADTDYVHQVIVGLSEKYNVVGYDVVSFSQWEIAEEKTRLLPNLDMILENNYDLAIIQVGENIHNLDTFEDDYQELIRYIKRSNPNIQIVLVGDCWPINDLDPIKKKIAKEENCSFVDISNLFGSKEYMAQMDDEVLGDDDEIHNIEKEIVALHPNDQGMEYIADCILKIIR